MTLQDKQNFVNVCNTKDGDEFIKAAFSYLQGVSAKEELNDFVNIFGKISKIKTLVGSAELTKLCLTLRDKVYDILIANGDVPENNYIYLYNYYSLCELDLDPRYEAYERFVDQNLYGADVSSDMERMFLIVLRFFAAMANSKKDAFEKFLSSSMRLNLIEVGSVSFSEFVSRFIDDSNIAFEETLGVVEKLLDKEFYFSLDKTQRRSIFNWSLHSLWLVERYFNHPSWVLLYPKWKAIFYEHIARNECDEAMYVHFFIYHKMGNSFQTQAEWKMFNEEIDKPASEYYKKWCERANLPKCKTSVSDGKKIIGFLWDRFAMNSPFKVAYSMWKALLQNEEFRARYEIKVYLMSYFEKSLNEGECLNMVENLGIEVFDGAVPFYNAGIYHSHLEKALYIRQKIIDDGVDILIHGSCYDINDFIVASRVAPKQIYWSHGNQEYDIKEIDKKITHCSLQGCVYNFESFVVPMDIEKFYNPYRDPKIIEEERAKYPKDAFVLGVIGRLVKVDSDEYLETIAKIMHQNPNTIFIAAGGGNVESIKSKVEKLGIADRFYTPGYVDPHVYGHIIDLWCDTFPLAQGESVYEFLSKNKPIVVLNKNGERGPCDESHIVPTVEQYIAVANSIITNKDFRESIVSRLNQIQSDMFERSIADFIDKFYAFTRPVNLPSRIALELTPKCNLSCGPCPRHYINERDGFMDEKLFKKLVDEIKTFNDEVVLLPFWRGESCLHPKFDELIWYALDNKIRMHISTNGHFMEDWRMDIFYRFEFVSISLHTDIGYKNAIKLISSKPAWSKTKFQISFIDSEKSVEKYLHEIIDSKDLKGFDSVRLYKEHTIGGIFGKTNYLNELGARQFCPKLENTLIISWDGYYSRCSHIWSVDKDLNLKNTTIENVWHGSRMEEIRNNYPDNLCLPCDQWSGRTSGEEWNILGNEIIHTKYGF